MHPTENDVIKYHRSKYGTNEKSSWSKLKMANWMQYPFSQWSKNAFHCERGKRVLKLSFFVHNSPLPTPLYLIRLRFMCHAIAKNSVRTLCVLKSNTECERTMDKMRVEKKPTNIHSKFSVPRYKEHFFRLAVVREKEKERDEVFIKKTSIRNIVLNCTAWIRIKLWPNWDCVWTNLLGGNWWDVKWNSRTDTKSESAIRRMMEEIKQVARWFSFPLSCCAHLLSFPIPILHIHISPQLFIRFFLFIFLHLLH